MSAARRQSPHVPTAAERFGGGDLIDSGVVRIGFSSTAPKYCPDCGSPYPWTSAAIETLEELAMLDDESDEADRTGLVSSAEVAMSENPKTNAAALKVKKLLSKAGKATVSAAKDLLVDVLAESTKRTIWSQQPSFEAIRLCL